MPLQPASSRVRSFLRPAIALFALVPLLAVAFLAVVPPPPLATGWLADGLATLAVGSDDRDHEAERLINEGMALQREGRYAAAVERYRAVISRPEREPTSRDARYLLGEALYLDDRDAEAIAVLDDFVERYPDDPRRLAATGIRAKAHQIVGNHLEAIRLFREYRATPNTIDGYLALEIGESLAAVDRYAEAAAELNVAASAGLARISTIDALEKLADVYGKLGDHASVALTWQRIAPLAQSTTYQAEVRYRQAVALAQVGRAAEAANLFLEVMRSYPQTGWAAAALREGAKLGADPGPYLRGIILYHADREAEAIAAFTDFLNREPSSPNAADALLHRGLSHRYLGAPDRAAADFDRAATVYPGQRSADEALFQAGQMYEALGRSAEAAPFYRRLIDGFPASSRREEARLRLALVFVEQQNTATAEALLTEAARTGRPEIASAAHLWLGKLAAGRGDRGTADTHWRAAEQAAPVDFYGLRARALRNGESIPSAPVPPGPSFRPDDPNELLQLDRWVGALAGITVTVEMRRPGPALLAEPAFQRGDELLRAGFYRDAIEEFRDLAEDLRRDPISLYQLALWLDERDLARATAHAGEQLVALSPNKSLAGVPRELLQLVLPTPYRSLVDESTRRHGVDPALLMALMRQESVYDRYARSVADARGLTQVMPATGEGIARNLGRTNFTVADLYRPEIAIEFGAFYLAEQLRRFGGNAYFAMGAYNAGPGAIPRWTGGNSAFDPDLFVERITYRETASYVRLVGTYYYLYRLAYRE
ncbi:MAG: lytic transglycosylase [Dehalococcoidia bacterium]|nr:MAG: lytic transglycosylase [Dehalococcoidia bacterium]